MKKNLQYNGLQITGQSRGGIQANIPMNKYSKFGSNNARQSPYLSKAGARKGSSSNLRGTGASNTDSELYGNGGGIQPLHARPGQQSNIGIGSRNASISLAQRQQERRDKEKAVLKEVESQKKAVLEKLNKI